MEDLLGELVPPAHGELRPGEAHHQVGQVLEPGVAVQEGDHEARQHPEGEDPQEDPGVDDPELVGDGHGHQHGVHGEGQVHELHLSDHLPKLGRAHLQGRGGVGLLGPQEVLEGDVEEVGRPQGLGPPELDDEARE